jgi:inward rectifier potassium channel
MLPFVTREGKGIAGASPRCCHPRAARMERERRMSLASWWRRQRGERLVRLGTEEVISTDAAAFSWGDPYHLMLSIGWRGFLGVVVGYYVLVNLAFGALYALHPASVLNLRPGSLADAFFFSVETFATVGYGVMAPQTFYGHAVATVEVFFSLLSSAVITGLLFVRLSRPRPSILFGRVVTVCDIDGVPTLTARVANSRTSGVVMQPQVRLMLIAAHRTLEGHEQYRGHELVLVRPSLQVLVLSWNLHHRIDEASPLYGLTTERLEAMDAQIVLSFTGTDQTLVAPVHAMHAYNPADIAWGHRFADMLTVEGGRTRIELARMNDLEKAVLSL